jgi:hypothetical protein
MAWRIHDSVIRGEIDNREKGSVRGRIWLHGVAEPIVLDLQGNAHPDLAGCLLQFDNPCETFPLHHGEGFQPVQRGTIGDLTASRKVRVFDVPVDEALELSRGGEKPPEHMANCLYLEWFSEANGRVVIESVDYQIKISPPSWKPTPEEDAQRAELAAESFSGFLGKLSEAVDAARHEPPEDKEWDEFDYEKFLRESDAITDKYMELLDKYGDSDGAEELISKEMGWDRPLDDGPDDEDDEDWLDVDELNRACEDAEDEAMAPDPHTEGVDWIRTKDGDIRHPLQHRCFQAAMRIWHARDELGLERSEDDDLVQFITEFQITGAKLAGALNGLAYGRDHTEGAFTVACLKRALGHLHKAQAGLESVAPKKLFPENLIAESRRELFAIREEILRLMDEFRGRT